MREVETSGLAGVLTQMTQRDEKAFAALYRWTAPSLYGLALRITRDPSGAEEVVREIFVKLWSGEAVFDAAHGAPLAWLQKMARNRALDLIAHRGRKASLPKEIESLPDPALNAFDGLIGQPNAARLRACLEKLNADQRRAILFAFFEGATHEEMAEHLAMPLGDVEGSVRRGLLKLKGCLL